MNKMFLIIENMALAKRNLALIKEKRDKEGFRILTFSDSARFFLESRGVSCVNYHDLEINKMYDGLYAMARKWGSGWYRPRGKELFLRDGYSLGCFLEWSMIYFFSRFLMLYLLMDRMMTELRPERIVVISEQGFDLEEDASGLQNVGPDLLAHMINVSIAEKGLPIDLEVVNDTRRAQVIKKNYPAIRSFCEVVNAPMYGVWRVFDNFLHKGKKVMFFEGARHFYNIVTSAGLKNISKVHLQKQIGPSLMPKFYLAGVGIVTLKCPNSNAARGEGKIDTGMLKEDLKGFFDLNGKDLLDYVFPRLVFLMEDVLPGKVSPDLTAMVAAVKKIGPDLVVVENDSTYFEKMLVMVSKKEGVTTAVVQNGATLHKDDAGDEGLVKHDFLPLISDTFFAYGEWSRDWMLESGVDKEKIVITGGARFDDHCRKAKVLGGIKQRRKRVVFILSDIWSKDGGVTNHIGLNTFHDHIKGFLEIAARNPDVDFTIRPHSEGHCWGEIFDDDVSGLENVVISRSGGLDGIFAETDLVVGYISTALFEALMYGIPVISLDTGEFRNVMPLWKYGLSQRVLRFGDLAAEIEKLLYNDGERQFSKERIKKGLSQFNFGNDGKAAERIADKLREMVCA